MSLGHGASVVRSGLVLHLDAANKKSYPGSGTVWKDLSGNGNNGTLVNGPVYTSAEISKFTLDGINDYGVISHNDLLKPTDAISFDCWVNITTLDSTHRWLVRTGWVGAPYFFGINVNNRFVLVINDQIAQYNTTTAPLAKLGWHHYAGVYNKNTIKMYVDAIDSNYDFAFTSTINTNTLPVFVGAGSNNGTSTATGQFWKNDVSNVRMYNRALSAAEIQQNFEALRGRYGI